MVKIMGDSYEYKGKSNGSQRYITIEYNSDNESDMDIIRVIFDLLDKEQPSCSNCINYQSDGYFCGYESHSCKIHGNIEWVQHPYHDGDASKCEDYKKGNKLHVV